MFLIEIKGANIGSIFDLNKNGKTVIGRGHECDIRILDLMISRVHCQIEGKNGHYYVRDLNSTNKTIINENIIENEKKLNESDILQVGDTLLLFSAQKNLSVNNVEDFERIRQSRTKHLGANTDNA